MKLLVLISLVGLCQGLGCIPQLCDGNTNNDIRECEDGTCGKYEGVRFEKQIIEGVDVLCDPEKFVYAPFDGALQFWRPFAGKFRKSNGEHEAGDCADKGIKIEGENQWQGYVAFISYVEPNRYGGRVKQGDFIGKSISVRCMPNRASNFAEHITFQLKRSGKLIDPTYHLKDCMCTGQICESNSKNEIVPPAFKGSSEYNGVKGWELNCPNTKDISGPDGSVDPDEVSERSPFIYSPIDGKRIGRMRVKIGPHGFYKGCDNDAVFVVGRGKWEDYTVKIYNVRFLGPPDQEEPLVGANKNINQRQAIAKRMDCGDGKDTIFIEFRHFGRLVNMTDAILANNCKVKPNKNDQE